jgi:hypothetical protein
MVHPVYILSLEMCTYADLIPQLSVVIRRTAFFSCFVGFRRDFIELVYMDVIYIPR